MPNDCNYDNWTRIYHSWNTEGTLYYHLLDKEDGKEVGLYHLPELTVDGEPVMKWTIAKFADPEVYLGNEGFHQVGAPEFIPKDANQPADSAAGVILSYWLSPDNEPQLYVVDGVTMEAVAVLNLPIPKMPSVGLHNHFSKYPPSV